MKKVWIAFADKLQELPLSEAAYRAFAHYHPNEELIVESKLVPDESNVSALWHGALIDKPRNERESIEAVHRNFMYLTEADYIESQKPDYYIALSFGLNKSCYNEDYLAFAWAAVSGEYQEPVYGRSASFVLPPHVAHRVINDGLSFIEAMKTCYPTEMNKHADEGLVAILSDGKVTDADMYASAIQMALIALKNRRLY